MRFRFYIALFYSILLILSCSPKAPQKLTTEDIFKKVKDSIVYVGILNEAGNFIGSGTGVIVSKDGYILTNWHVVEENAGGSIQLQNGASYAYNHVLELDPYYDLALVKVDAATEFQPAVLANSDLLNIGQKVIAIGNPKGMKHTVSEGIISSFRGGITDKEIQFTAPISPGSSGGALLDEYGRVIGITSSTLLTAQNINFAKPINFARAIIYRRTIPLFLSKSDIDLKTQKDIENYIPGEVKLLEALMNESLDANGNIKAVAMSLEQLQKRDYDTYQKASEYLENQTAKGYSYLIRQGAFIKAMNAIKNKNKELAAEFENVLPSESNNDTQKIMELKEFFVSPYYFQVLNCAVKTDKEIVLINQIQDYEKDHKACLDDTQSYLDNKQGNSFMCTVLDGKTAQSSCVKKKSLQGYFDKYFQNEGTNFGYFSGVDNYRKKPLRLIFQKYNSFIHKLCQMMVTRKAFAEPSLCIPPV